MRLFKDILTALHKEKKQTSLQEKGQDKQE